MFRLLGSRINKNINTELTVSVILCLISCFVIFIIISKSTFNFSNGIDKVIGNSDRAFIDLYTYKSSSNEGTTEFINRLSSYYGLKIYIVDSNSNVLVQSNNIDKEKIVKLDTVKQYLKGSYDGKTDFYSMYPIEYDSKKAYVIITSNPTPGILINYGENSLFAALMAISVFIILLLLIISVKTNYIKEITRGILEISKGNLDFHIKAKGNDELKVLAENINSMSNQLKCKINDERIAEKTKSDLITNVSHDLKTPLTSIIGYLTLLKDRKYESSDQMNEYINKSYIKSQRLQKLIIDLFEYTKLNNGAIKLNKTEVNLVELLDQLIGELTIIAEKNNLTFKKCFTDNEIIVSIDSNQMVRVFENILINAIKYSSGQGKIYVKALKQYGRVIVMIENEGDTIPEEDLTLLFDRFYRVEKSRMSQTGGSGLGLAIAKSIVELHGGEIWAESCNQRIRIYVRL